MSLCNICEGPATMHIGAGPRCDAHQYHEGLTLPALRLERECLDRIIAERLAEGERSRLKSSARSSERPSLPPVLAANTPTRELSNRHFQEAHRILATVPGLLGPTRRAL